MAPLSIRIFPAVGLPAAVTVLIGPLVAIIVISIIVAGYLSCPAGEEGGGEAVRGRRPEIRAGRALPFMGNRIAGQGKQQCQ